MNFEATIRFLGDALSGTFYECLALVDAARSKGLAKIAWATVEARYVESLVILHQSDGSAIIHRHMPVARCSRKKLFERLLRAKPTSGDVRKMKDDFVQRRHRCIPFLQ
jgi:hypothetical protein